MEKPVYKLSLTMFKCWKNCVFNYAYYKLSNDTPLILRRPLVNNSLSVPLRKDSSSKCKYFQIFNSSPSWCGSASWNTIPWTETLWVWLQSGTCLGCRFSVWKATNCCCSNIDVSLRTPSSLSLGSINNLFY